MLSLRLCIMLTLSSFLLTENKNSHYVSYKHDELQAPCLSDDYRYQLNKRIVGNIDSLSSLGELSSFNDRLPHPYFIIPLRSSDIYSTFDIYGI